MKEICFICSGNECRSPMAEKLFSYYLKQKNIKGFKITSAGLGATEGTEMTLQAKRALKKLGVSVGAKKSKQLKTIKKNTLYIVMEQMHKSYLKQENVLTFASLVDGEDIKDPYGLNQEAYDKTANQINYYCLVLLSKIKSL